MVDMIFHVYLHIWFFKNYFHTEIDAVYPKKYAHGFVVLCFVVVMQSFIMNSHKLFIHIHQGCFAGTGAIVRLPQCQRSKPDGYEKISQCITTTKHSKAKTVCIFLGIYCSLFYAFSSDKTCLPVGITFCMLDNHKQCIIALMHTNQGYLSHFYCLEGLQWHLHYSLHAREGAIYLAHIYAVIHLVVIVFIM